MHHDVVIGFGRLQVAVREHGPQHRELPAQRGAAATGCRIGSRALFVSHGKRVIEVVERAAAGDHEVPRLLAIGGIGAACESRFVEGDGPRQPRIQAHRLG